MEQTELINWLKDAAKSAGEFVQREAPLVANEIVAWHYWSHVFLAGLFVAGSIAALCYSGWLWREALNKERTNDWREAATFLSIVAIVASAALLFAGAGANVYQAIKAKVAPRVVIIKYIRRASK